MSVSLRPITAEEFPGFFAVTERAFGSDVHADDVERERLVFELERSLAAYDGDQIVATAGIYGLDLTVPGATLPMAGVTFVGVLPTHRRRGILNALMQRQIEDVHAAGREPVAGLWASEAGIYGRYGYGLASRFLRLEVRRDEATLRADAPAAADLSVRVGDVPTCRAAMAEVYDAVRRNRPGFFTRNESWWSYRLADPERRRDGGSALSVLVAEDGDGRPRGYALYRTWLSFDDDTLPSGRAEVLELVSDGPAAHAAVCLAVLNLDLMTRTVLRAAADDPLLHLLADPRRARPRVADALWIRPVDLGAALAARCYAVPVDVVLDVRDDRCPWNSGRWRLSGDATGAVCAPTADRADLALGPEEVGAAYLGGTTLAELAGAGRVEELTGGALVAASAAFSWHRQPQCPMVF